MNAAQQHDSSRRTACARLRARRGLSILYVVLIMTVVFAFASLALDYGRVQLSKTQLQITTDSAAKYAVQWVSGGASKVLPKANEVGAENDVNGDKVVYAAADVKVGSWDPQKRLFTANARPRNAVEVSHTATIPLALGKPIGKETSRVRARAVAMAVPMAIVGLNGFSFKNNTFVASYDSSSVKNPNTSTCSDNGALLSNGYIGEQNNGTVRGDCYTGPAGSVDPGFSISGGTAKLASPIPTPTEPAWSPSANPGGITNGHYVHNSGTPLNGGTYWFTKLTVSKQLKFNGPATIYVNGDITTSEDIVAYQSIPANLTIYQIGAGRKFDVDDSDVTARVVAPRSDFVGKNNVVFCGACVFNTITVMNNAQFYYDESMGLVASVSMVQ